MLSLPAAATIHLDAEVTTIAVCWRVTRRDGQTILGTQHDEDVLVTTNATSFDLSGIYSAQAGITGASVTSTSDMAVDNTEVNGALDQDLNLIDLSAADIDAGLFDDARIELFLVNWAAPDDFQIILRSGSIGEISRSSEGRYRTELRGLTQQLSQTLVRTYGASCDAELGDARCGVILPDLTVLGTVTAVTSNRSFEASLAASPMPDEGYFVGGLVRWGSGDNEGFSMEVKQTADPVITLYLPMPRDIQVGDTFALQPGCDKTPAMCKVRFNNLVNFRGHGAWVPGVGEMMTFGGQTAEKRPRNPNFLLMEEP